MYPYYTSYYTNYIELVLDVILRGPDPAQKMTYHITRQGDFVFTEVSETELKNYAKEFKQFNASQLLFLGFHLGQFLESFQASEGTHLYAFNTIIDKLLESCLKPERYKDQMPCLDHLKRYKMQFDATMDTEKDPRPAMEMAFQNYDNANNAADAFVAQEAAQAAAQQTHERIIPVISRPELQGRSNSALLRARQTAEGQGPLSEERDLLSLSSNNCFTAMIKGS